MKVTTTFATFIDTILFSEMSTDTTFTMRTHANTILLDITKMYPINPI